MKKKKDKPEPMFQLKLTPNANTFVAKLPVKLLSDLYKITQVMFPSRETGYMRYSANQKPSGEDQLVWYLYLFMMGMRTHFKMDDTKFERNFERFCKEFKYLTLKYEREIEQVEGIEESIPVGSIEDETTEEVHSLTLSNGNNEEIPLENYNIICATATSNDIEISNLKDDDLFVLSDTRDQNAGKNAYIKEVTQHLKTIKDRLQKSHTIKDAEDLARTCAEGLMLTCDGDIGNAKSYLKTASENYHFINIREVGQ